MTMDHKVSCETQGHLWNGLGYCVMCKAVRPDWQCSECGEPCNASVPHTCYEDYRELKAEVEKLRGIVSHQDAELVERLRPALQKIAYNGHWSSEYMRKVAHE